ncbi:PspC domain-containing protein [Salibacterium sp. K-3]
MRNGWNIQKSRHNRSISGVCGGIAVCFNIPALPVRLAFLLLIPAGLVLYLILANVMPEESAPL